MTIVSILVATVVAFIWSSLYYSPLMVMHAWQKAVGLKKEDIDSSKMMKVSLIAFVLYFLQFFILGFLMTRLNVMGYESAIIVAVILAIFLELESLIKTLYEQKKMKLFFINMMDTFVKLILGAVVMVALM